MDSPVLAVLGEPRNYWDALESLLTESKIKGPAVHDARIAALSRAHGVHELWSADRDFSRFGSIVVRNPLVAS